MALGIGAGDEVITSPFTFFATAGTIARTGARPAVLRHRSRHISTYRPLRCEASSTSSARRAAGRSCTARRGARVRALMPVHLYGQVADMEPLMAFARRYGSCGHRGCGAGHRRRRCGRRAAPASLRRHRLLLVLPQQEPRRLRRCRHVHHRRTRPRRAHAGAAGARRQDRSITTRSSAATSASTSCRRRCCASSCKHLDGWSAGAAAQRARSTTRPSRDAQLGPRGHDAERARARAVISTTNT